MRHVTFSPLLHQKLFLPHANASPSLPPWAPQVVFVCVCVRARVRVRVRARARACVKWHAPLLLASQSQQPLMTYYLLLITYYLLLITYYLLLVTYYFFSPFPPLQRVAMPSTLNNKPYTLKPKP